MFNRLKDRVISASAHYYVCSAISFTAINKIISVWCIKSKMNRAFYVADVLLAYSVRLNGKCSDTSYRISVEKLTEVFCLQSEGELCVITLVVRAASISEPFHLKAINSLLYLICANTAVAP